MRIVLADPPNRGGWRVANHPNLGILYLSSFLKKEFKDIEVIYLEQFLSFNEHIEKVVEYKPDIYGMSFASLLAEDAIDTIREVKKRIPQLPIICGGPHPSAMPEDVAAIEEIDACGYGEGEETICDLIRYFLLKTMDLKDIPGIAFRSEGEVIVNPKRALIHDLDTIPFPDWDLISFDHYMGNYQYKASPSTAMIWSRGCPYDCNFCSNPVWKVNKPWVRVRSAENICKEIQLLYDKGIRDIYIRSDEVNINKKWSIQVFKEVIQLNYKDLYFQSNIRADNITDEMVDLYKKMGGWLIYLGIESGSDRTLKGIEKYVTLEQIENACRIFKSHDIDIFGLFMIFHVWEENGKLQHETYDEVNKGTLGFIRKLRKQKLLDYISFTTTTPMPGSKLWHTAVKFKLFDHTKAIKDLSEFSMKLPNVTMGQMKRIRLKGMLLQLWFVLHSGNTRWSDLSKIKTKIKYLVKSLIP